MGVEETYDPRYVDDLSDVPISGPDEYTAGQKRKALFDAESQLEADVNDGEQISSSDLKNVHQVAVMNLATCILAHAAEDPSSVTLGDMASGGGTITEYSNVYCDKYDDLIQKITSAGIGGARSDNFAVIVNNGKVGDNQTTYTVE